MGETVDRISCNKNRRTMKINHDSLLFCKLCEHNTRFLLLLLAYFYMLFIESSQNLSPINDTLYSKMATVLVFSCLISNSPLSID